MEIDESEQYASENYNAQSNNENSELHMEASDDDEMTAERALQALENAWLNEKFAPELLPHQQDLVDCMLEQISHMEENLKRLEKGDIRKNIHTMEISRIRFIIASYLRKRLDKIEEYAIHVLAEDAERTQEEAFMTPAETRFAREYVSSIESLFTAVALKYMPPRINNFELNKIASKPNMNKHVFVKANKRVTGILIPGSTDEEVDFEEGSQHIIQYNCIAHLVKSGDVQLI